MGRTSHDMSVIMFGCLKGKDALKFMPFAEIKRILHVEEFFHDVAVHHRMKFLEFL